MTVRRILTCLESPQFLRKRSEPVRMDDPSTKQIIQDLKDTLLNTQGGAGLAAPQIGVLKRIFVLQKSMIQRHLTDGFARLKQIEAIVTFINPKIIARGGETVDSEGCLSVPGRSLNIERAKVITVRAFDEHGNQFHKKFKGFAARAIQQEMDHLDGILIIDKTE